jgi:hypothetical protein
VKRKPISVKVDEKTRKQIRSVYGSKMHSVRCVAIKDDIEKPCFWVERKKQPVYVMKCGNCERGLFRARGFCDVCGAVFKMKPVDRPKGLISKRGAKT